MLPVMATNYNPETKTQNTKKRYKTTYKTFPFLFPVYHFPEGKFSEIKFITPYTVKPIFFACPLFREFRESGKFAKITDRENLNTVVFQCSRKQKR